MCVCVYVCLYASMYLYNFYYASVSFFVVDDDMISFTCSLPFFLRFYLVCSFIYAVASSSSSSSSSLSPSPPSSSFFSFIFSSTFITHYRDEDFISSSFFGLAFWVIFIHSIDCHLDCFKEKNPSCFSMFNA